MSLDRDTEAGHTIGQTHSGRTGRHPGREILRNFKEILRDEILRKF
jgi:hypothetical protein